MSRKAEIAQLRRRCLICFALSLPVLLLMLLSPTLPPASPFKQWLMSPVIGHLETEPLIEFVLSSPVMIYGGRGFVVSALKALRARYANMDVMLLLGVGTAYLSSVVYVILTAIKVK